jgi:hypothetical protein
LSKIIKILFFYKLNNYLKKQNYKVNMKKLIFTTIKNYYNCQIDGLNLSLLLKTENYIYLLTNGYSSKSFIFNIFLKKWFYLRINP